MRLAQNLLALSARLRAKKCQALLLPIQSTVAARHLLPLAKLAHSMHISVRYTLSTRVARSNDVTFIRAGYARVASEITTTRAHRCRWTLIVVADHGHFRPLLLNGSPIAHIGHGNPSKVDETNPGLPWEYGHAPRTRHGDIAYDEMIEASDLIREALIATEPALARKIRVLGRLADDDMLLRQRQDRTVILQELGLNAQRPVLLVVSTLRENSLFGRYWDVLLEQLRKLAKHYQVLLCPHPGEYAMWAERLGSDAAMQLLPAGISTEQALPAASMLIADFTSLCQKAALLGLPMVLAHCEPLPVWSEGATRQLYAYWPVWDGRTDMQPLIEQAMRLRGQPSTNASVTQWINSHLGQSRALYAAWLQEYFPYPLSTSPAHTQSDGVG